MALSIDSIIDDETQELSESSGLLGRLGLGELGWFWLALWTLFSVLTGSWRWSAVLATFGTANLPLVFAYFAVPPPPLADVKAFLSGFRVGAHRGLTDDAPENTLAAFRKAKELGADCVELDVEWTSDKVLVVLHDATLDRTTDAEGRVGDKTFAQLANVDAAAKHPLREMYGPQKVPSLEEALELLLSLDVRVILDVKIPHADFVPALAALFAAEPRLYERAVVCSFFPNIVYQLRRQDPKVIVGHTWRPGFYGYEDLLSKKRRFPDNPVLQWAAAVVDAANVWATHNVFWRLSGASLCLAETRQISGGYVAGWRSVGVETVAWTSNSLGQRRHFLQDLRIPLLTDRLSDFQKDLLFILREP